MIVINFFLMNVFIETMDTPTTTTTTSDQTGIEFEFINEIIKECHTVSVRVKQHGAFYVTDFYLLVV